MFATKKQNSPGVKSSRYTKYKGGGLCTGVLRVTNSVISGGWTISTVVSSYYAGNDVSGTLTPDVIDSSVLVRGRW